ncbi:MAG: UvrD-helicase domain-containing protein [Puniceicoccales bacterium]|nr:UvrD-helicase domain-containing protein [Puniceicoccales bacterium]
MKLPDQMQRNSFSEELAKNFSVIASAGAGKTTAIAARIANFLLEDAQMQSEENSRAKKFLAVTYTEKAAKEIRDRVFLEIFKKTEYSAQLRGTCVDRMEFMFFGTIHAFAAKFLRMHCPLIGLRSDFEVAADEDTLWQEFISEFGDVLTVIPNGIRENFSCAQDIDELLKCAKNYNSTGAEISDIGNMPIPNIDNILTYKVRNSESRSKQFLRLLEEWESFRRKGNYFPMPDCTEICGSGAFIEFCQAELKDFLQWKQDSANFFLHRIAQEYKNFRINSGKLTYDDLINLAVSLLSEEIVAREIEKSPHRIILDEAQDTDAQQFRLLLGVSQGVVRNGISMDTGKNFPGNGYFSMVGDPQQSIYCDRASVKIYSKLHDSLVKSESVRSLTFSTTMRCSTEVVNFVNEKFPHAFSDVKFVPLEAKPGAQRGRVIILQLKDLKTDKAYCSSLQTAEIFRGKTFVDFGVEKWADIAILAPRKDWLLDIYQHFSKEELLPEAQLHFENANWNRASPIRWLAACLRYINNPADQREFAGILRELFGVRSQEIIDHFKRGSSSVCTNIESTFAQVRRERYCVPLAKFLLNVLDRFKIFQRVKALNIYSGESFSTLVKQTIELCYFAEANGLHCVEAENFFTKKINGRKESESVNASAVQFVTFHKSKGLEWPVVVVPFLHRRHKLEGGVNAASGEGRLSELRNNECRLLYVACTRAKKELLLLDDFEIFGGNSPANTISSGEILFGNDQRE